MFRDVRTPSQAGPPTSELPIGSATAGWALDFGSPRGSFSVPIQQGEELVIGSGAAATIRLEDRTVSARHCRVAATPAGLVVEDLGSKNGLYLAGARVPRAILRSGGTAFVIGESSVAVEARAEAFDNEPVGEHVPGLIGDSRAMRLVAREVRQVAPFRVPVLIQGESGTGKDVVARSLHELSKCTGAFVPLNAAAITESLADAELFGHCRGAFTGAVANRPGAFELAHQGTLFLDEVADLTPSLQVRLLRVVEDGRVRPVGGAREVEVNVRIVSASWATLSERAAAGCFREDLLHRLSTVVIRLPPLRERRSDIPQLSAALLARFEPEFGSTRLGPSALARLVAYDWPGNVRELSSALYRAALRADGPRIDARHLDLPRRQRRCQTQGLFDATRVRALFAKHGNNVSAAARAAGVPRSTFRGWLERAGQSGQQVAGD